MWKIIKFLAPPLLTLLTFLDLFGFRQLVKLSPNGRTQIYFLPLLVAMEFYSYQAIKTVAKNKWVLIFYIVTTILIYAGLFYYMNFSRGFNSAGFKNALIIFTIFIVPKIFLFFFLFIEDLLRIISYVFSGKLFEGGDFIPTRRKAITWIGLGIALIPFSAVLDGIFFGKYRFRVIRKTIYFDDLPEEFDGFTITQISDLHSGSFDNLNKVKYGIELTNQQNSDVLIFSGDMVNNIFSEVEPYKEIYSTLKAPLGMYATLGNHDYGGYGDMQGYTQEESVANLQKLQREMGFDTLNNEMRTIERNGKRLNIVGVENWGNSHYFPKRGDLDKATKDVKDGDFNVLISHDPSHWDHKLKEWPNVLNYPKKMHLTLAGHTHGMQFGIEIPGVIKWSPVEYRYHNWAGLYEQNSKYLYVNRGFGYLAFPGRVGIWPEITVIELKRRATS